MLPLNVPDALANADRFPLAMAWMPVRQGSRSYDRHAKLGCSVQLFGKKLAILIMPAAHIPPSMPCPALSSGNLCSIHAHKPQRCKTMPFYAYRAEEDQTDLLVPKRGWLCDVAGAAPVVYQNRAIVDRVAFDQERAALVGDAPLLKTYANKVLAQSPATQKMVMDAAAKQAAGQFVMSFYSFLRLNPSLGLDISSFADKQIAVLETFAKRTQNVPEHAVYCRYYESAAQELQRFVRSE